MPCNSVRLIALPCLALIAALLMSAAPAWARETIEGDGYSLDVPVGYRSIGSGDGEDLPSQNIKLTGGLSVEGTPEVFVYIKGQQVNPASLLLVSRIDLAEGSEMSSVRDLQRYLLRNMSLSQDAFSELVAAGGVEMTNRKVGRFEALEMRHSGTDGPLGVEQPATRALTVLGGDFLLVVMLLTTEGASTEETVEWEGIVTSLDVDPSAALIKKILLYGGAGLAAFSLLLFLLRVMGRGQGNVEPAGRPTNLDSALSAEGWGRTSSPTSGQATPQAASLSRAPSGVGGATNPPRTLPSVPPPAPAPTSAPAAAPPGLGRSQSPASSRSPMASAVSPASSPSGAVGTLPTSPTSPRGPSPSPSTLVRAPSPGTLASGPGPFGPPPESAPEEAPRSASGGLRSTLPPSGRWGQ